MNTPLTMPTSVNTGDRTLRLPGASSTRPAYNTR